MHGDQEIRTMLPLMACAGDVVIVKQTKINKLTPTFNPTRLRITAVNGSRITAREIDGTWTITRDASYFKKITDRIIQHEGATSESDQETTDGNDTGQGEVHEQETQGNNHQHTRRTSQRKTRTPEYLKDYET